MAKDPKDTICRELWSYPVIDLTRPKVRVCCKRSGELIDNEKLSTYKNDVFLNLPAIKEDRLGLLNGEQVSGCKQCWDLENKGLNSFRLGAMDFQFHFNNDIGQPIHWSKFRPFEKLIEEKDQLIESDMPNKLDIQLGSFCDQKCVYCNWTYSSQWDTEDWKFGRIDFWDPTKPKDVKEYKDYNSFRADGWYEAFISWFDTIHQHLERIALLGGEPTFSPLFKPLTDHIIKRLNEKAHPNCTLVIVTNLNWKNDVLEQIRHLRKSLPSSVKLTLEVSMESFGSKAEYIRFGVNWDRFVNNLKAVSMLENVEVKLCTTLNALCITSIQEYFELIKIIELDCGKNFEVISNRLVYPKWLSVDLLDASFSHYIENFISWLEIYYPDDEFLPKANLHKLMKETLEIVNGPTDKNMVGYFTKWIDAIDARRDINFLQTFPEFKQLYTEHKEYGQRFFTFEELRPWQHHWDLAGN